MCSAGGPGQLIYPTGVAQGPAKGTVLVVDSGNHRLQTFDIVTGEPLQETGSAGGGDGQFGSPKAVVCACGKVVISDAGQHRLSIFSADTLAWDRHIGGAKGAGIGEFNAPDGLAIWKGDADAPRSDQQAHVFVADSENHRVQVVELGSGRHVRMIGHGQGSRPGQFSQPTGMAIDARSRLLVGECRGRRVQVLSMSGEPLQVCKLGSTVVRGICCPQEDSDADDVNRNKVYCCDFANHRVAVLQLLPCGSH